MAYQDGDILIRAVMSNINGLPADNFVNDFAFRKSLAQTDAEITDLMGRVDSFYRTADVDGVKVSDYISPTVNRSATHKLQAYRITAGGTGSPIREDAWLGPSTPVTGGTAFPLPNEVAAVVSFNADLFGVLEESGSTRPKARRRGRLYIGPLQTAALDGFNNPKFVTPFLLALRRSIIRVAAGNDAAGSGGVFSVWSRRDATLRRVTGGWTDNAPDIQRRRGIKATVRTVYTV